MSRALSLLLVFVVVGLSSGCAPAVVPPDEPRLEVGTGTWRFEPLNDGDGVELIRGAQGGWHVWVAVQVTGVDRDRLHLSLESQPADERTPPQQTELEIALDPPNAEGKRNYLGWPEILWDPSCMVGELLRVRAVVSDETGLRLEDERYITILPGSDPPSECTPPLTSRPAAELIFPAPSK